MPPHIGYEYGIAGLEFSDLSRSGGPLEARVARQVGIVDIDQADRHTLRGEFEGSDKAESVRRRMSLERGGNSYRSSRHYKKSGR